MVHKGPFQAIGENKTDLLCKYAIQRDSKYWWSYNISLLLLIVKCAYKCVNTETFRYFV